MVLREIHFVLTSRIDKNGAQPSACGAAFLDYEWSIPTIHADFLTLASKLV
jgi:hypothetical protein